MSDTELEKTIKTIHSSFNELKDANEKLLKQYDPLLIEKIEKINEKLDSYEPMNQKLVLAEQQNKVMQDHLDKLEGMLNTAGLFGGSSAGKQEEKEYRASFDRLMRKASDSRDPKDMAVIHKHMNALIKADDVGAGFLLAPPDMLDGIIKDIVLMSPVRSLATIRTIGSDSYRRPRKTGTGAATRVGETQARTNTGDPAYGLLDIKAPELYSRVELSLQMMEDSGYDLMAELREDSAQQFAVTEGQEFISGAGDVQHAEGILTNGSVAEVTSGNATAIRADSLIDLWKSLPTVHARNANFGFSRATLGEIRKLKNDGQYLWQPGIAGSVPNTILSSTYVELPDMPAIGANTYPVIYGDFKAGYVIVDRVAISFQADYITGADNGLVVFRGRKRVGGGVMLPNAFRKLKIAA